MRLTSFFQGIVGASFLFPVPQLLAQSVFINEIHYDNQGPDQLQGVEIAGPSGTVLSGWMLLAYDGATGTVYSTTNLSGIIPDQQNGYGTLWFSFADLENGPDALWLMNGSTGVQFISYEGVVTATN